MNTALARIGPALERLKPLLQRLNARTLRSPTVALGLGAALGFGLAATRLLFARRRRASRLRVAFVHAEDVDKWSEQMEIYVRAFDSERAFEWREYKAWLGELPALGRVDMIFVSGSGHNVTDDSEWIARLLAFLRAAAAHERVRLVGICFGCQAIAAALGGSVGTNEGGGFAYGIERLWPTAAYAAHPAVLAARKEVGAQLALADDEMPAAPRVLESHGQCVLALPPGATLLASTASAAHELFSVGGNVLCAQFHAEFSPALLEEKVAPALLARQLISAEQHREAVRRFAREYDAGWAADTLLARALIVAHVTRAGGC